MLRWTRSWKTGKSNHRRCSVKKVFLKILQNWQKRTYVRAWHWFSTDNFTNFLRTQRLFYRTLPGDCFWWRSLMVKFFNSSLSWRKYLLRSLAYLILKHVEKKSCITVRVGHLGYVTYKFSTLPMVKGLFVVTCWNELKIQPYGYFNPVLIRHVFTIDVKLRQNHAKFSRSKKN